MSRVEVISRFFLALASSLFLFISGVSLPPLGVIILPFVAQPVLVFGLKYGVGAGLGVICLAILLLVIFAGEELALIYAVFAVLVGLLFGLLGRIRAIEQLVLGVAIVLSSLTAGLSLYFYGSWSTMFRDLHAALTQQHHEVGVGLLEQLEQPVLDLDVVIGPRDTERDGRLQCPSR